MKNLYLRIEHLNEKGKVILLEYHNATMDKNYIYFDKYKVKKSDTEEFNETDKRLHDRSTRNIKVYVTSKRKDSRFIKNN